jgi:hypothetical protein
MSKLRSCFLWALGLVVLPLLLLGFRVAAGGRGLGRRRTGKLSIWGDSVFQDLCKASLDRLKTMDPGLYRTLTNTHWIWVFQSLDGAGDAPPRLIAVNRSWTAWQSEGVVARLAYAAFCMSLLRGTCGEEFRSKHRTVMSHNRSWLRTKGFPGDLVCCFAETEIEL